MKLSHFFLKYLVFLFLQMTTACMYVCLHTHIYICTFIACIYIYACMYTHILFSLYNVLICFQDDNLALDNQFSVLFPGENHVSDLSFLQLPMVFCVGLRHHVLFFLFTLACPVVLSLFNSCLGCSVAFSFSFLW